MKLIFTVGKFYRTMGGIKAECIEVKERRVVFRFYHECLDQTLRFVTYLDGTTTDKEKHIVAEWQETKDTKALIDAYEAACNELVKAFAEKQNLEFDYQSGGFYSFNETYQFQLSDILLDLRSEQPAGFIQKWFNGLDTYTCNINYNSYIMARGKVLKTNTKKL